MGELTRMPPQEGPIWTPEQVAQYLNIPEQRVRRMARQKELPGFKCGLGGKIWRFRKVDVDAWIESQIKSEQAS